MGNFTAQYCPNQRSIRLNGLYFVLACLVIHLIFPNTATATVDKPYPLSGPYKFSFGDDPAWSRPAFDDSAWRTVARPGARQSQALQPGKAIGWYRIRFNSKSASDFRRPALMLGRIGAADEVFVNGVKVGGEGVVGEDFVIASQVERVYEIPRRLLNKSGDHIIAVRVMSHLYRRNRLEKDIVLGEYDTLFSKKLACQWRQKAIELCFLAFLALYVNYCLFVYLSGIKEKKYAMFGLMALIYALFYLLNSLLFYETGYKTHLIQHLSIALISLFPAVLICFLVDVYDEAVNLVVKCAIYPWLPLSFWALFISELSLFRIYCGIWVALSCYTAVVALVMALRAHWRQIHEAYPVLLGIAAIFTGAVLVAMKFWGLMEIPVFWIHAAVFLFFFCFKYGVIKRYSRFRASMLALSGRILDAHEEERKRLARELHDGVGQSLLAAKLNLQMMQSRAKADKGPDDESLPELIDQMSNAISELREVAMDLRPSFLEETDIRDALLLHGKRFQDKTGIRVEVAADSGLKKLTARITDHLYRLYQEALSNILKHAEASVVQVNLGIYEKFLRLVVSDNGRGFTPGEAAHAATGIGLSTMQERIELLGGRLKIESAPGKGTSLYMEVPLK